MTLLRRPPESYLFWARSIAMSEKSSYLWAEMHEVERGAVQSSAFD